MSRSLRTIIALMGIVAVLVTCRKDPDETVPPGPGTPAPPASPVNFDPANGPHELLSTYNFYQGTLAQLQPVAGVLPYALIDPLFTDHALKQRHVWMPDSVKAAWNGNGGLLDFPDGAVLLKTFYYDQVQPGNVRRLIETRMMYRWGGEWHFANYVWNDEQTDAVADLGGSNTPVEWTGTDGLLHQVDYRIPAEAECGACHKEHGEHAPVGPRPRNMARPYTYADGVAQQLDKWAAEGLLEPGHPPAVPMVDWQDGDAPLQDRVRAYLDINCGHCHSASGYCNYRPMRFAWEETTDPANLGICVEPHEHIDGQTHIVAPTRADRSMMYYRLNTNEISQRMPLLGRSVLHTEALEMIEDWIDQLTPPCE
ncbi:MAG: hypothetical protein RBT71_09720 [Flavobacteriales bacterium]|jgi:uncharacterized repeat protein (TIGR03806 family)|nr:hypothetical protein [Flavobacteriales bacterium]